MHVFIHNFAYIEKGVKYRGKKFIYPRCLKVRFPNLDSSLTISALARTSLQLKNISMNLSLENSTFLHLGNNYLPKCWKVLFSKPRFIEIFFSSSEVQASAGIVRDEFRFGNCTF